MFSFFVTFYLSCFFFFFSLCFASGAGEVRWYVRARTMGKQNFCLELWKGRKGYEWKDRERMDGTQREKGGSAFYRLLKAILFFNSHFFFYLF